MNDFLNIFMTIYEFMKNTTILTFSVGEHTVSLTFLQCLIGTAVIGIGIDMLHNIFDW